MQHSLDWFVLNITYFTLFWNIKSDWELNTTSLRWRLLKYDNFLSLCALWLENLMLRFFVYPGYVFDKIWIFQFVHDMKICILTNTYFFEDVYNFVKYVFTKYISSQIRILWALQNISLLLKFMFPPLNTYLEICILHQIWIL